MAGVMADASKLIPQAAEDRFGDPARRAGQEVVGPFDDPDGGVRPVRRGFAQVLGRGELVLFRSEDQDRPAVSPRGAGRRTERQWRSHRHPPGRS